MSLGIYEHLELQVLVVRMDLEENFPDKTLIVHHAHQFTVALPYPNPI
jgi:hypothetical protein